MLNDILLHEHDDVTPFAAKLMELTKDGKYQIVRMRNGNLLEVTYWLERWEEPDPALPDYSDGFCNYLNGNSFNFYIDGKSVTSRQFDIIEIVGI